MAWFGPKGFAVVVYGLLVLISQIPAADMVFHPLADSIVLSASGMEHHVRGRDLGDERHKQPVDNELQAFRPKTVPRAGEPGWQGTRAARKRGGLLQREDGEGPAIQRDSPGKPAESAPKTSRQFQQFGEGATEFFDRPLPRAAGAR